MKIMLPLLFIILSAFFAHSAVAQPASFTLSGKHAELGLKCASCHEVEVPERRAPQSACKNCHTDMSQSPEVSFKDEGGREVHGNPHNSHVGEIRCTLCHQTHQPSKLYCNEACHHTFKLAVP